MIYRTQKQNTGGYTLVETLVAITNLLLSVGGPMTIAAKGLQSSYFARDQLIASMLAQEGVEAVIAIRNQKVIEEFNDSGPIDQSASNLWSWASDSNLSPCFAASGCNIDVKDNDPSDDVTDCSSISNCQLKFHKNAGRAKYHVGNPGTDSGFYRYITLEEVQVDGEIIITSTVLWYPKIFSGIQKEVSVTTSIFNQYAQP